MTRAVGIVIVLAGAVVALGRPDPLAPRWSGRAFEEELGGKGVILELAGDPRRYQSFQVGFFVDRPGAPDAAEHAGQR